MGVLCPRGAFCSRGVRLCFASRGAVSRGALCPTILYTDDWPSCLDLYLLLRHTTMHGIHTYHGSISGPIYVV